MADFRRKQSNKFPYSSEAWTFLRKTNELIQQVKSFEPADAAWAFQTIAEIIGQVYDYHGLEWTADLHRFP